MCGIGGWIEWQGKYPPTEVAGRMLEALEHRGPDENGREDVPGGWLVHTRLAILDPANGREPMVSPDGRWVLTYNGEIYNFRILREELRSLGYSFQTNCDAEVVLRAWEAWGPESVPRLTGMFAFAIFDTHHRELFLVRDRLGIKPLVYAPSSGGGMIFASELRALMEAPLSRIPDPVSLDLYLHYQYIPAPRTIYRNVFKLPPATILKMTPGSDRPVLTRYWRPSYSPEVSRTREDWHELLRETLETVVKDHLISDVPFGAFLSGGVDSSTVVYHMRSNLPLPVESFTIGFDEPACDERTYARAVAASLGCRHRDAVCRPDLSPLLDTLAQVYGEPFADSSAIPTWQVSQLARSHGVKMVLSGDGADELFAGYNTYPSMLSRLNTPGNRILFSLHPSAVETAILRSHGATYAYFQDAQRDALYTPWMRKELSENHAPDFRKSILQTSRGWPLLTRLQHLDLETYLCGDILAKVDAASMAHALEVRVPLLDHRMVELAFRIPASCHLNPKGILSRPKQILKDYIGRRMEPGLFDRPKSGFGIPVGEWLAGPYYAEVRDRLSRGMGALDAFLDSRRIGDLVANPERTASMGAQVWAMLMLQSWEKEFLKPRKTESSHALSL